MARIISVSNHKGGVGKTTTVANLAFSFARQFKTLLIDLDPQSNLSSGLGYEGATITIGSLIKDLIHYRQPEIKPQIITKYVHIIPSSFMLNEIENLLHERVEGETILNEILSVLKTSYDLIFIDCPPGINFLTLNALNNSDLILIPAKPEFFCINGIEQIKSIALAHNIPFLIFFNQVNKRSLFHKKIMRETSEKYNGRTLNTYVRNNVSLAEAFGNAKDIFHYKSNSTGAHDFIQLADEMRIHI